MSRLTTQHPTTRDEAAGSGRQRPLRVGLLVDSLTGPRWLRRVVEEVKESGFAELALVVRNADDSGGGAADSGGRGLLGKLRANREHLLYAAYTKLDEAVFKVREDAFERVSIEDLVEGCPVIDVRPRRTKHSDYFEDEDLEAVRAHDLDVALRFGFRILRGGALGIARYGVWSYHHGDGLVNRGGPPGFWEVMLGEPLTGSMLQVLTEELDGGRVIYRSWASTNEKFSVRRNKNNYYWKSAAFVARKLRELYELEGVGAAAGAANAAAGGAGLVAGNGGDAAARGRALQNGAAHDGAARDLTVYDGPAHDLLASDDGAGFRMYHRRLYRKPTNSEMAPLLARLAGRAVSKVAREALYLEQWCLAYRFGAADGGDALYRFKYLVPPKDRFWADPFPAAEAGKHFVFFEEYVEAKGRAHISAVELDRRRGAGEPFVVLEREHHLSYPFVFGWRGDRYMIPESAERRAVELYRCRSFPGGWEPEATLLEGVRAADATLEEVEGRWWMFVNIAAEEVTYNYDELHLFHAPTPLGPWRPHRRNPVKSDARSARPAGRLFRRGGALYRPAQDCSGHYGYGVTVNRVLRLTPDEYREEEVSKILPEWEPGVVATHTINFCDGLMVVDCKRRRRRF
jgi:hypothetical protein